MLSRPRRSSEELFEALQRLRMSWPGGGWSWDNRLSCVASSFDAELQATARAAAELALPEVYTERTVRDSPLLVRGIAEMSGGVRSDQLVLASQPIAGVLAYGLWWPWRNGITLSLRVGLAGGTSMQMEQRVRDIFGADL